MTWRPILIIFGRFPKIGRPDRGPFQARMAVLLACPSLSGKSKPTPCQRALGGTCEQESVASGRVWREQKKLWARCFNVCLSSESKMLIVDTFSNDLANSKLFGSGFWGLPVAACYEKCASASRLVSLWRILFEVSAKDWYGVERVSRLIVFWFFNLFASIFSSMTRAPTGLT